MKLNLKILWNLKILLNVFLDYLSSILIISKIKFYISTNVIDIKNEKYSIIVYNNVYNKKYKKIYWNIYSEI